MKIDVDYSLYYQLPIQYKETQLTKMNKRHSNH